MKYVKFVIGVLLMVSGLIQFGKVVSLYLTLPFNSWPIGAEMGTIAIVIAGFLIFKDGLKKSAIKKVKN